MPRRGRETNKKSVSAPKKAKKWSISTLYRTCIDEGDEKIRELNDQGLCQDVVLPFLKDRKPSEDDEWKQACYLLALFVTIQSGTDIRYAAEVLPAVLTTLQDFDVDDPVLIKLWIRLVRLSNGVREDID